MKYIELIIITLCLLNFIVSIKLFFKESYDLYQKIVQFIIIWVLPFVGAILIFLVMKSDEEPRGPSKPKFGGGANESTPV